MSRKAFFDDNRTRFNGYMRDGAPDTRLIDLLNQVADHMGWPPDAPEKPAQRDSTLQASPVATDNIMAFEGLHKLRPDGKVEAYPDPASGGDPWTIGYGATGAGIRRGTVWTREQAEERLQRDVAKFSGEVAALLGDAPTTQNEFDALVSFAFNVGSDNLANSTLLRKHKAGDKQGAAVEFGKWVFAAGKRMSGLVRRRQAEAAIYRGGA